MNIEAKIATLKTVAALDAVLSSMEAELAARRLQSEQRAQAQSEQNSRVAFLEASVADMERARSEVMQEVRRNTTLLDKSREKLARCRNEREINATQRELDELRRIQKEREGEIQKLAGLIEQARTDLEAARGGNGSDPKAASELAESGGLGASSADGRSDEELLAEVQTKKQERASLLRGFDGLLLRRYEAVRQRRGSGIARVHKGYCTACHMELPPMVSQQMMHGKEIFTCPSCLRILYTEVAPAEDGLDRAGEVPFEEESRGSNPV